MAIGIDRSSGYIYAGSTGVLNGAQNIQLGQSVKLYLIETGLDLSSQDDAANEAFEAVVRAISQGLLLYYSGETDGKIHAVVDGMQAPDASVLQTAIRALGTINGANLTSTTVSNGTAFVVS
jgi:hypothetical protein